MQFYADAMHMIAARKYAQYGVKSGGEEVTYCLLSACQTALKMIQTCERCLTVQRFHFSEFGSVQNVCPDAFMPEWH